MFHFIGINGKTLIFEYCTSEEDDDSDMPELETWCKSCTARQKKDIWHRDSEMHPEAKL
jgi:hypothetical protein